MLQPYDSQNSDTNTSDYTRLVGRYMRIDSVTTGKQNDAFALRFVGQIYGDSAVAYDALAADLRPLNLTPMFRPQGEDHAVLLVEGVIDPPPSKIRWNILMFVLTLISVIATGALMYNTYPEPNGPLQLVLGGLPFALSMLGILLAHEFGHYLVGRWNKTAVSLPYFIPFPLSPFGTMGAFIQMKEQPKNKRVLMDIGIAGPLSGLVVAIPVLLIGLALSQLDTIDTSELAANTGFTLEGNSLLYLAAKYLVFGQLLPAPADYGTLSPLMYWARYFFTGQPIPYGGLDVMIHPMAWAGWAGLLVTSLNLIPAGQLDGGHLVYVLLGQRARRLWPFILLMLVALGFVWSGWWLWAALIFFLGRTYAEPLDTITQLDPPRRLLAVIGIIIFILVFTPVPLILVSGAV